MPVSLVTATAALGTALTTVVENIITAFGSALTAFGTVGIITSLIVLGVAGVIFHKLKSKIGL